MLGAPLPCSTERANSGPPERAGEMGQGAVPDLFRAAAQASCRTLGDFLSAGKFLQYRVTFDGFVRPGTATGLGATST